MIAAFLAAASSTSEAGALDVRETYPCPECFLPRICCFEPTADGFVVTLCGSYSDQWRGERRMDLKEEMLVAGPGELPRPRAEFRAGRGWRWLDPEPPSTEMFDWRAAEGPSCARGRARGETECPAEIDSSLRNVTGFGIQGIGELRGRRKQCIAQGRWIWFGVDFYAGEGSVGVGGVGRFDLDAPPENRIEIRRPKLLRRHSAAALLHDGHWLWLAPYFDGEWQDSPELGIVRYAWGTNRVVVEPGATCGAYVMGMAEQDGATWIATGMNLSRRDATGRWQHLAFRPGKMPAVEVTTCSRLYEVGRRTVRAVPWQREFVEREIRRYADVRRGAMRAAAAQR